jgi:hypothetical protein
MDIDRIPLEPVLGWVREQVFVTLEMMHLSFPLLIKTN